MNVSCPIVLNTNTDSEEVVIQLLDMYEQFILFLKKSVGESFRFSEIQYSLITKLDSISKVFYNYIVGSGYDRFSLKCVDDVVDMSPFKKTPYCEKVYTEAVSCRDSILNYLESKGLSRVSDDEEEDTDWR